MIRLEGRKFILRKKGGDRLDNYSWRDVLESDWFPEPEVYTPVQPVLPYGVSADFNELDSDFRPTVDASLFFRAPYGKSIE